MTRSMTPMPSGPRSVKSPRNQSRALPAAQWPSASMRPCAVEGGAQLVEVAVDVADDVQRSEARRSGWRGRGLRGTALRPGAVSPRLITGRSRGWACTPPGSSPGTGRLGRDAAPAGRRRGLADVRGGTRKSRNVAVRSTRVPDRPPVSSTPPPPSRRRAPDGPCLVAGGPRCRAPIIGMRIAPCDAPRGGESDGARFATIRPMGGSSGCDGPRRAVRRQSRPEPVRPYPARVIAAG